MRSPSNGPRRGDARNGFIFRLAVFFAGVAIGLVMLGMFQRARQASAPQPPAAVTPGTTPGGAPGATPGMPTSSAPAAPAASPPGGAPGGQN